jgi:hypothetical protein
VFERYCDKYNWDPYRFSIELATLFAGYLSKRTPPPITMRAYISALNSKYATKALGSPWAGGEMTKIIKGYALTMQLTAQNAGTPRHNGNLRVGVPVSVVKLLLTKSETYLVDRTRLLQSANVDDIASAGTATTRLCWCAIFWLMLLYGFRADTMGGMQQPDDLRIQQDGIRFMIRRVKRQNNAGAGLVKPFVRQIPPPRTANSLRGRVHRVIDAASAITNGEGKPHMLLLQPTMPSSRWLGIRVQVL